MDWLLILVAAALAAVVSRVYVSFRRQRRDQTQNWDAKVIERLRAQGSDPFSPYDVDFFFASPDEAAVANIRERLEAEGFAVDSRRVDSDAAYPYSIHGRKSMRLSAPDMRALSAQFATLAKAQSSRYDGWTA